MLTKDYHLVIYCIENNHILNKLLINIIIYRTVNDQSLKVKLKMILY